MKTIFEHLHTVKQKPHHVRKQVAFGAAAAGTGLVALVWVVSSLAMGVFAIQGSSFAESVGQVPAVATYTEQDSQNLAGAAAAFSQGSAGPARIEIVNVATTTPAAPSEKTVLPF